ncbi:hypothetical protein NUW54_g8561 [Trametes sanguinea]|uniref:Uncharacterized protein n=1 Tax=Trametes sanguinea TaxID=158606 RepID=A0ACC1PE34_9APHY|nr:hypothetical protein NUW54_g8561 [Trametes sanguinea]
MPCPHPTFGVHVITIRSRGGWTWRLNEILKDKSEEPMRIIGAFLRPVLEAAIAKSRENKANWQDQDRNSSSDKDSEDSELSEKTLRLYPTVPFNIRQAPDSISYSVWMMHRRKDYWGPDAWHFVPDRWLDERLNKYFLPNPFIFVPYNAGPRICVGPDLSRLQFAYDEMSYFIIRLLQSFASMDLDSAAQPPDARPPPDWANAEGQQGNEKIIPKCHLTLYVHVSISGQEVRRPSGCSAILHQSSEQSSLNPASNMSTIKALAVLASGGLFAASLIPPTAFKSGANAVYRGQPFEYLVRFLAWLGCCVIGTATSVYAALLSLQATHYAAHPMVLCLCPTSSQSSVDLSMMSPRFITGVVLVFVGASLRLQSYRALGSLFTYEIVLKDEHRLVTSGPYAYVRHPSYSGLTALLIGTHLVFFGKGAYVTECGIEGTPFIVLIWIWRIATIFSVISCCRRCSVEDAQLRQHFGRAWEDYRRIVPYCMLPRVF